MENLLQINVGTTIESSTECMGNLPGTSAVCFDKYRLGGRPGYQMLFPNKQYCGFSADEIREFFDLDTKDFEPSVADYQFSNVMQLGRDIDKGVFSYVWQ